MNNPKLNNMLAALHAKPPPKFANTDEGLAATGKMKCGCGKKIIPFREITKIESCYVEDDLAVPTRAINRTCVECKQMLDENDMCPIICLGCREVIAYLAPGVDEDKFIRDPRKVYHLEDCPNCNEEKFKGKSAGSELKEKTQFLKLKGYKN